jgi:hypothetical protein
VQSHGNADWDVILSKLAIVAATGGVGAYAVRQSTEHRRSQRMNEHVALQLAAIKPYVSYLQQPQRDELLAEIAHRIFGQPMAEANDTTLALSGPGLG